MARAKPVDRLTIDDLKAHPVWRYSTLAERDADLDETAVLPVKRVPVVDLANKVVGTKVLLANGSQIWALLGNVHNRDARLNAQFLTLSAECKGKWFYLARYHDIGYEENDPAALATFLGLSVAEVFPISYDLRAFALGDEAALKGVIIVEPQERLSENELIALALG